MYQQYIDYFKHQATAHPSLGHADTLGQRVFAVIDQQAAAGDFRAGGQEKGFIMRLVQPVGGAEGDTDNVVSVLGGFIIARYHSPRIVGDSAQTEAIDECWYIGMQIIAKILADSQNGHPLWYHSANSLDMLKMNWQPRLYVGDAAYSGWLFTFRWRTPFNDCTSGNNAPEWTDGGLTPYP